MPDTIENGDSDIPSRTIERQIMESASTMVRELTRLNDAGSAEQLTELVHEDVLAYMKSRKLYGYA